MYCIYLEERHSYTVHQYGELIFILSFFLNIQVLIVQFYFVVVYIVTSWKSITHSTYNMPQFIDTQIYCEVTNISGERQIKHNITWCHAL